MPSSSHLGVVHQPVSVYDTGGQKPPFFLRDPARGDVAFMSGPDDPFVAYFQMLAGCVRGNGAYHKRESGITAVFDLIEGAYAFVTSDALGHHEELKVVKAPHRIVVPPGHPHTFITLGTRSSVGVIIETSTTRTSEFLDPANRDVLPKEHVSGMLARVSAGIAVGQYSIEA